MHEMTHCSLATPAVDESASRSGSPPISPLLVSSQSACRSRCESTRRTDGGTGAAAARCALK
eukprot:scaffold18271_cov29-Tisochrysis_lutea.AAC.3